MATHVFNTPPNINDTVLGWARSHATDGLVKANLVLRMATDSNWVFNHKAAVNGYSYPVNAAAMMNCGLPGMRIPGLLSWSVQESLDNPVSTASWEAANALPVSQTSTTLAAPMAKQFHSTAVIRHWYKDGSGVSRSTVSPPENLGIGGDRILYREFQSESVSCVNLTGFPDPRIPADENDAQSSWPQAPHNTYAVGSYFILVGNEVMRVHNISGNTLSVPAGGRGVNGIIEAHNIGDPVSLLGFGPFTGRWAGIGYLANAESKPYKSMLRPGTCFASYEGYGDFNTQELDKQTWSAGSNKAYEFTGYWFVTGQESSLGDDGVPKMSVTMASTGHILQHQQISPIVVFRLRNQYANWAQGAFDQAGINRVIPNDWLDYQAWEPDRANSYPLAIKTEFAQHKQFFDHMNDTEQGKTCELCQQEYTEFVTKYGVGKDPIGETRAVGKHIYHESIRVYNGGHGSWEAGPLRTYGRLMIRLAQAAWETPIVGNALQQRWTKIPQNLWDNMANLETGRVWNGQLSFQLNGETNNYPWAQQVNINTDVVAHYHKDPLLCPFESSYDKQDWFQPIQDLADINRMTFLFDRRGYPIFAPKGLKLRGRSWAPEHDNNGNKGDWFMGWGGSIASYNYNMDTTSALTLVQVTGTTAFESEFTVTAAGTGIDPITGQLMWYSPVVGNREGLMLSGGCQQMDTISLDNMRLGLDWNTNLAGFSLRLDRGSDGITQVSKFPARPESAIGSGRDNSADAVLAFKRVYNFLRTRLYVNAARDDDGSYIEALTVNSDFTSAEVACIKVVKAWLKNLDWVNICEGNTSQGNAIYNNIDTSTDNIGTWYVADSRAIEVWAFSKTNQEFIKTDVWWYALGGYSWDYYVAAVTGLAVPERKADSNSTDDEAWTVDQLALRKAITNWQQNFFKQAINIGNHMVDDSIAKATVRTVTSNFPDPRIQLGDVVYLTIPGYLDSSDAFGDKGNPNTEFENATYITTISRQLDLQSGTGSASYSGYRYTAAPDQNFGQIFPTNYFLDIWS